VALGVVACHATTTTVAPSADLRAAEDAVALARQELVVAAHILARQKQLHEQGEPQRDVDQAQAECDERALALRRAEERLASVAR
jgi:hypothetical protein